MRKLRALLRTRRPAFREGSFHLAATDESSAEKTIGALISFGSHALTVKFTHCGGHRIRANPSRASRYGRPAERSDAATSERTNQDDREKANEALSNSTRHAEHRYGVRRIGCAHEARSSACDALVCVYRTAQFSYVDELIRGVGDVDGTRTEQQRRSQRPSNGMSDV